MPIALIIVDDCRLYREGLATMLGREPDIECVATAHDWPSLEVLLAQRRVDIVLVNLATAASHALMDALHLRAGNVRVIAIGVTDTDDEIIACAEAGIAGYLLRTEPFSHLIKVVRSVAGGETVCSPRASAAFMRRLARLAAERQRQVPVLTDREDQILGLLEHGLSNQQIAKRLDIEVRTVKNHLHNLFAKLGVSRRGEAAARARALRGPSLPGAELVVAG